MRPLRFLLILLLVAGPVTSANLRAAELPKDLLIAEEMIRDGLARDAVKRIRAWLQKNTPPPQLEGQVLLAEALLADGRAAEAIGALPKTPPADLANRVLLVRASALNEAGRWKEAMAEWKRLDVASLPPAQANQARLGRATALLNENEREAGKRNFGN